MRGLEEVIGDWPISSIVPMFKAMSHSSWTLSLGKCSIYDLFCEFVSIERSFLFFSFPFVFEKFL